MSQRHGQALPPPPRISQGHQGRLERLLFAFTREQLALARFATLAVGVRPGEAWRVWWRVGWRLWSCLGRVACWVAHICPYNDTHT